ncbi:MAG: hypothetical protein HY981_03265, partial [Candidatus Magasanikbacteria bacterium]|nr:hypothetical protein [Candidatus Magasanikbacteria bacterium]
MPPEQPQYPDSLIARPEDLEEIPTPNILSATTKEGKEITFNLEEQLKYWGDFYQAENIDWVSLPDTINLTQDQQEAMKKLMEQGFDKMI